MDRTRVLEIIAAYGADVARWPADERDSALALAAEDAALQVKLDAAASLDAELAAWAAAPVAVSDIDATASADAALARVPVMQRWWPTAVLGGSVAAALVAAVAILPTSTGEPSGEPTQVAQSTASGAPIQTAQIEQDVQLWGSVFTLTPEEESLI
jgi:hypothetical protein